MTDNVVGTFIKKLKPLESSRFGVFFKYDPKTHSEVAKIHRLKPGLTAPSIN
jgi:hypothetical protein